MIFYSAGKLFSRRCTKSVPVLPIKKCRVYSEFSRRPKSRVKTRDRKSPSSTASTRSQKKNTSGKDIPCSPVQVKSEGMGVGKVVQSKGEGIGYDLSKLEILFSFSSPKRSNRQLLLRNFEIEVLGPKRNFKFHPL